MLFMGTNGMCVRETCSGGARRTQSVSERIPRSDATNEYNEKVAEENSAILFQWANLFVEHTKKEHTRPPKLYFCIKDTIKNSLTAYFSS